MRVLIVLVTLIWGIGLWHMWRKQSASRPFVSVHMLDRVMALFWPAIYLMIPIFILAQSLKWREDLPVNIGRDGEGMAPSNAEEHAP